MTISSNDKNKLKDSVFTSFSGYVKPRWDGADAIPIQYDVICNSMVLMDRIDYKYLKLGETSPSPDGRIIFNWYGNNGEVFFISVGDDSKLSYSGIYTENNQVKGTCEIDNFNIDLIVTLIKMIYN